MTWLIGAISAIISAVLSFVVNANHAEMAIIFILVYQYGERMVEKYER